MTETLHQTLFDLINNDSKQNKGKVIAAEQKLASRDFCTIYSHGEDYICESIRCGFRDAISYWGLDEMIKNEYGEKFLQELLFDFADGKRNFYEYGDIEFGASIYLIDEADMA
jgi:hypothetical protein